jgi:hypothetical protein
MAIGTVQITGKVLTPSGDAVTSGTIELTLSDPGSVLDGGTSMRIPGGKFSGPSQKITLGAGGALPGTALVAPNDAITPAGTHYTARFSCVTAASAAPVVWTEQWQVASSPASIAIGAILRVATAPPVQLLVGPQGATGATGPQGPQGIPGPAGTGTVAIALVKYDATFYFASGVNGVSHVATGRYAVTFTSARPSVNYVVSARAVGGGATVIGSVGAKTVNGFELSIYALSTHGAMDTDFDLVVFALD